MSGGRSSGDVSPETARDLLEVAGQIREAVERLTHLQSKTPARVQPLLAAILVSLESTRISTAHLCGILGVEC